jgi:hypothetical protein
VLAVLVLLATTLGQAQQQQDDKGSSPHMGYYKPYVVGDHVIEWPYPQSGDRPSHYPPYYRDTQ